MPVPTKPTAPSPALRSNPDTFSANAEATINYQFTSLPDWIEDIAEFCEDQADAASAAAAAAGAAEGFDLTGKAGFFFRVNAEEDATEFVNPALTLMLRDGSASMTGNLSMGGVGRITGLVAGTSNSDAVRKDQVKSEAFHYGMIMLWAGNAANIPSGWALCNGQNGTPDLRDRFVVGAGAGYTPYATGGANTVALAWSQMPPHIHDQGSLIALTAGGHRHFGVVSVGGGSEAGEFLKDTGDVSGSFSYNLQFTNSAEPNTGQTSLSGAHPHSISGTTGNAGAGGAHENRPPYFALCYIMKV